MLSHPLNSIVFKPLLVMESFRDLEESASSSYYCRKIISASKSRLICHVVDTSIPTSWHSMYRPLLSKQISRPSKKQGLVISLACLCGIVGLCWFTTSGREYDAAAATIGRGATMAVASKGCMAPLRTAIRRPHLGQRHQGLSLASKTEAAALKDPEIRIDSPLKIEAVLFDLDGTLLDFEGGSHDALNKVLEPYNSTGKAALTWEMHGTIVGRRASEWSAEILEQCGISPDVLSPEKYVEMYLAKMPEYYPSMPLMPGALNLVKNLKAAGYKVAVASSSERLSIEKKLKFHPELLEMMDIVQPGDDPEIKAGKPAPDIFLAAARKLGVKPENCLVFEDSPFGLQGAKAGNMYCAALPDGRMPIADPARFGAADFVLNSMDEFKMDYIEKI